MLLPQSIMQFEDANGLPRALAQAKFSLTGTTTPTSVYSDAALLNTIVQPVTADSAGLFPEIFIDPDISTRMRIIWAGGDFANPALDVDPINELLNVTSGDLADGAIEAKLGYTPVDPANGVFTAPVRGTYSPTPTALHTDDLGFRGTPVNLQNADYTFVLNDSGMLVYKADTTAYTWTIPPNSSVAFPIGHWIDVLVASGTGAITVARGSGVALRVAASATDGNKTLAIWGKARLTKIDTNSWVASGTGIS